MPACKGDRLHHISWPRTSYDKGRMPFDHPIENRPGPFISPFSWVKKLTLQRAFQGLDLYSGKGRGKTYYLHYRLFL